MAKLSDKVDSRVAFYQKLLRRLRADPRLWDENPKGEQIYRLIGLAKERMMVWRSRQSPRQETRGPYSGLTRSELAASGTCEPDWY